MNTAAQPSDEQRKLLEDSQREATEQEPQNYKDESTGEKVVEIGPELTEDPIQGLDPDEPAGKKR